MTRIVREWTVASLLQRVAELEEALQPFAALAPSFDQHPDAVQVLSGFAAHITAGDLRRAKLVLARYDDGSSASPGGAPPKLM